MNAQKKRLKNATRNEDESDLEVIVFGSKQKRDKTPSNDRKTASKSDKCLEKKRPPKRQRFFDAVEEGDESALQKEEPSTAKEAWVDDDDNIIVKDALRDFSKYPRKVESDQKYKTYLESKFKEFNETPKWSLQKQETKSESSDSDEEDNLQATVGDHISKSTKLSKGVLNIKKCTNLNAEKPFKTLVSSVQFHPSSTVALVSSPTGTLNLFQVDGKTNSKIQTVHFQKFAVDRARFTVDGEQIIVGSKSQYGFYYYYDMIAGKIIRVPFMKDKEQYTLRNFVLSHDGQYLATNGEHGSIHLISGNSKEIVLRFKANGNVLALAFSNDSNKLLSHGSEGKGYVWDVRNNKQCIHRFVDQGTVSGTSITISPNEQYLVTGSDVGVVNIYDYKKALSTSNPIPIKTLMNLTTEITSQKFNHTSELLAISSSYKSDAIRCVHFPSMNVFSNFPHFEANYKQISEVDISLNSGYLTFGTNREPENLKWQEKIRKPPKIYAGIYLKGEFLGNGTISKVNEVLDISTLQRLAVKRFRLTEISKKHNYEEIVRFIKQEAFVLMSLNHKNIIKVVDILIEVEEGLKRQKILNSATKMYLIMEYCASSVEEIIRSAPLNKLPVKQAHSYFTDLINGLEYIHSLGIIHKDIKPQNLLVTADEIVKITDFGVCEKLDQFCRNDLIKSTYGTKIYQPPEMFSINEDITYFLGFPIDIWASGVTLYRMITGKFPFGADYLFSFIEKILNEEFEITQELNEDISLLNLLVNMLNKDPFKRITIGEIQKHPWFIASCLTQERVAIPPRHESGDLYRCMTITPYLHQLHSPLDSSQNIVSVTETTFDFVKRRLKVPLLRSNRSLIKKRVESPKRNFRSSSLSRVLGLQTRVKRRQNDFEKK
ncbi:U3 small nucleolar RNA-associated protein 18-like protein [Dinothrombium tinctorium]|uniref:U3 small nucleolar RNA-associated protein 18-like protein n=1 Tax=Dinothrombium tinctorium TaxID=1965070 RepID=A0A443QSB1_9ACAR|nr:U3 small nucleolar RNA-associated protein 18-like protein [Dinothrombium tinctorium]RWS05905.1 U3 small nucleolar RNA-associated protein 18-like protein [Dinothrombium tinctorium]RWS05987.1 U3 small nucleolar RNA-associated protein 18-like protein [Dinothrombium tinctorium]